MFLNKVIPRLGKAGATACLLSVGLVFALANESRRSSEHFDPMQVPAVMSRLASSSQLLAVARAGSRLVAVGWRGHILISDDAGSSWKQVPVPISVDLTAVSFPTPKQGWAVGHNGVVLHSADGGQSWVLQLDGNTAAAAMIRYYKQRADAGDSSAAKFLEDVRVNTESGPDQPWLDVLFDSATHGYVVGTFNTIMETLDGGKSWTPLLDRVDNPGGLHLNAISAVKGDVFIASEQGTVFYKAQGSDRFVPRVTGYSGTFFGVVGNAHSVIAYGLRGSAYRSLDQGKSWSVMRSGVNNAITGATALKDGRIVAVTQAGEALMAEPSGLSFSKLSVSQPSLFAGVMADDAGGLQIVGIGGVHRENIPKGP